MPNESKYEIWKNTKGQWYWHFKAGNGEIVAGGEGYVKQADCVHAITLLKGSKDCVIYTLSGNE
jgi:uncharacterized protein YegP (UPF0339 family)